MRWAHLLPAESNTEVSMTKGRNKSSTTFKVGRDAKSGQFIPVREAQRRPNTTTVETIKPKPKGK